MDPEIRNLMSAKRSAEKAVAAADSELARADAALLAKLTPGKAYSENPNPDPFFIVVDGKLKEIRPVYLYGDAAEKK